MLIKNNIYYKIWADAIVGFRKHKPQVKNWAKSTFILITACNSINLYSLDIILNLLGIKTYFIEINIFPGTMLNFFGAFIIQYSLVFIVLNYFFIFKNNKYLLIIEKYSNMNGKLAMIYVICSAIIGWLSMIFFGLFGHKY